MNYGKMEIDTWSVRVQRCEYAYFVHNYSGPSAPRVLFVRVSWFKSNEIRTVTLFHNSSFTTHRALFGALETVLRAGVLVNQAGSINHTG